MNDPKLTKDTLAILKDKLQSWPGEMALTSEDVAMLIGCVENVGRLSEVCRLAVESQGWDGNDPDDDRWRKLYAKARKALIESSSQASGKGEATESLEDRKRQVIEEAKELGLELIVDGFVNFPAPSQASGQGEVLRAIGEQSLVGTVDLPAPSPAPSQASGQTENNAGSVKGVATPNPPSQGSGSDSLAGENPHPGSPSPAPPSEEAGVKGSLAKYFVIPKCWPELSSEQKQQFLKDSEERAENARLGPSSAPPDIKPEGNNGPLLIPKVITAPSAGEVERATSDVDYFLRTTVDNGYSLDDARIGFDVIRSALKPAPPTVQNPQHLSTSIEAEEAIDRCFGIVERLDTAGFDNWARELDVALAVIEAALKAKRDNERPSSHTSVSREKKNRLIKGMAEVIVAGVWDGNTEPWVENKLDVFAEDLGITVEEPKP